MENQSAPRQITKKRRNIDTTINFDNVKSDVIAGKLNTQKSKLSSRPSSSYVWNTLLEILNDDGSVFVGAVWCPICQNAIHYMQKNGTTGLRHHVNKCLPLSDRFNSANSDDLNDNKHGNLLILNFFYLWCNFKNINSLYLFSVYYNVFRSEMKVEHKRAILGACSNFVINDLRPVNAITGAGLHELLETYAILRQQYYRPGIVPQQLLPCRNTVTNHIKRRGNEIRENLKLILEKQFSSEGTGGAICTDIWHDKFKKIDYICVTAHYINENFQLEVRVIAHRALPAGQAKTGAYLKSVILNILEMFGIDPAQTRNVVFVTDRGSNLVKALEDFDRQNCGPHFISNTVNECFKRAREIERPTEILEISQKIVSEVKNSGKNGNFKPSLKMAIKIRWNSAENMFESISLNWDAVFDFLSDSNSTYILNGLQRQELDELIQFLKPFRKASLALEATKTATQNLITMYYDYLERHLIEKDDDPPIVKQAKSSASFYFTQTITNGGMITALNKLAVFLHPSTKNLNRMTPQEKHDIDILVLHSDTIFISCKKLF